MITKDMTVRIVRGCKAREIRKDTFWVVMEVRELGKDYDYHYDYQVKIVLGRNGRRVAFFARHQNQLKDDFINLNDGNPLHKIQIARIG